MTARDPETIDERLARLRAGTEALAPCSTLYERLDHQVRERGRRCGASGLASLVLPFGRSALLAATLAAAAALALVIRS